MKRFTSIFARMPEGAPLWCTLSLAVMPFIASAQAIDQNQVPVSNIGAMPMGRLSAAEIATAMQPFTGTGKTSEIAPSALLSPRSQDIRGLPPVSSGVGTESVIGADTRIRTYTT